MRAQDHLPRRFAPSTRARAHAYDPHAPIHTGPPRRRRRRFRVSEGGGGRMVKSEKAREILALLLIGAALFLLLAFGSFQERDLIGTSQRTNLCGALGYHLARFFLHGFGYS